MRRKKLNKQTKKQLLHTIYRLQTEWKHLERIVDESIEPSLESITEEKIARAKFMFLWNEARRLNIHAVKYK
ncbi:MAG TPA: YaaL family protein [Bacillota bacterium]|nr:YaaL family protein [Bacillota bacterium]